MIWSITFSGLYCALLQDLDHAVAAVELPLRRLVEFGAELGERFQFAELGERRASGRRRRVLSFIAAIWALPPTRRHRDADVHGRQHAGVLQVRLQVDLPVGDRDHVRRDVRRHFAFERLDDRQRRQRPAACRRPWRSSRRGSSSGRAWPARARRTRPARRTPSPASPGPRRSVGFDALLMPQCAVDLRRRRCRRRR